MNTTTLTKSGSASPEIVRLAEGAWLEAATEAGIDLAGYCADTPLTERLAWAENRGLAVGVVYSRCTSNTEQSTSIQVDKCVRHAAAHDMYVPPEFVCVDEGPGVRKRLPRFDRIMKILSAKLARVLLFFDLSRVCRSESGIQQVRSAADREHWRAISVTDGVNIAGDVG